MSKVDDILAAIDLSGMAVIVDPTEEILRRVVAQSGVSNLLDFGVKDRASFDEVSQEAVEFARNRAAEMVGMKYDKTGTLVENPNADFAITDGTREYLRGTIEQAVQHGWSGEELASQLEDNIAFSPARARTIARTEVGNAYGQGGYNAAQTAGMDEKRWLDSGDSCEDCKENSAAGWIDIDDNFPSGDDAPLAHPNCTCDVEYRQVVQKSYKLARRLKYQGLKISVEQDAGQVRKWPGGETLLHFPYGYIRLTEGADGDQVDCYIGPRADSDEVYVVRQLNPDGTYDEDKCFLGFTSASQAVGAYLLHRNDGLDAFGGVDTYTLAEFKQKLKSPGMVKGERGTNGTGSRLTKEGRASS